MKRSYGSSLYYFNDKAIYDGLSQKSVTKDVLNKFLLNRNTFMSPSDEKTVKANYLSRFLFDYNSKIELANSFDRNSKSVRVKTRSISIEDKSSLKSKNLMQIVSDELTSEKDSFLKENREIKIQVNRKSKNTCEVTVEYKDFDVSKVEIKQVETRTLTASITTDGNESINIRVPEDNVIENFINRFSHKMLDVVKNSSVEEIDLKSFSDQTYISKFFLSLIESLNGFTLDDVINVGVDTELSKIDTKEELDETTLEESKTSKENEEDFLEDEISEAQTAVQSTLRDRISSAKFEGNSLVESDILSNLLQDIYYISSITWLATEKKNQGQQVCLRADISKNNSDERTIALQIRYVREHSKITEALKKQKSRPTPKFEREIFTTLEAAKKKAFNSIVSEDND